jgi:hypothetical protein
LSTTKNPIWKKLQTEEFIPDCKRRGFLWTIQKKILRWRSSPTTDEDFTFLIADPLFGLIGRRFSYGRIMVSFFQKVIPYSE